MKKTVAAITTILLTTLFAFGQSVDQVNTDEEAIKKLEKEYIEAVLDDDTDVKKRLISDEFTVIDAKGNTTSTTKASVLKNSDKIKYLTYDVSGQTIKIEGDTATVKGSVSSKREAPNGAIALFEGKYIRTWTRKDGLWKITGFQPIFTASLIEGSKEVEIRRVRARETTANYLTTIHLTISGINLGSSNAKVIINGEDVSKKIIEQNHTIIKLESSKNGLNLFGKKENAIVVIVDGKESKPYSFSQSFNSF